MLKTYKHIFKDAIALLAEQNIKPISQNASDGSYYDALKKDHCNINLNEGYTKAYNLIRGVSAPYFGAAWYRRTISVPVIPAEDVSLWLTFHGVDEEVGRTGFG